MPSAASRWSTSSPQVTDGPSHSTSQALAGRCRARDMRVADALSSVGTDVCGDAVSPAARPTPQGAAGSGDPGVDSWVTRLPPARPGSGRGPGSTVTL